MKKSRKVISMLLALSMVTALSVPAFAAEPVEQQPEVIVSTNGDSLHPNFQPGRVD